MQYKNNEKGINFKKQENFNFLASIFQQVHYLPPFQLICPLNQARKMSLYIVDSMPLTHQIPHYLTPWELNPHLKPLQIHTNTEISTHKIQPLWTRWIALANLIQRGRDESHWQIWFNVDAMNRVGKFDSTWTRWIASLQNNNEFLYTQSKKKFIYGWGIGGKFVILHFTRCYGINQTWMRHRNDPPPQTSLLL